MYRAKQPLLLVSLLILAGCGGSAKPKLQQVAGSGYRFAAPDGWSIRRTRLGVTVMHGSELVQVFTFPLVRPYRPALFAAVAAELRSRMQQVAAQTGGRVADGGTVTAGGVRAHVFRLTIGDHVDEYTFVLVGRREYQLLCRSQVAGADACRSLQSTFVLA